MRVLFRLSVIVLISLSADVRSQQLNRITLYSAIGNYDRGGGWDITRSTFNFETGKSEPAKQTQRGIPDDYDISYGETEIGPNRDLFQVRDHRSMIVDLGRKNWDRFNETPSFPKNQSSVPPRPLTPTRTLSSRDTDVTAKWRQFVKVRSGHMYLARLLKRSGVLYVMFRVESLKPGDNCVLSWKRVPPPVVIDEKQKSAAR